MMRTGAVRDEREAGIDLAADRLSYLFLAYGVLAAVAYRAIGLGQSSWDLLGLLVLSGVVGLAYRMRSRVATRGWAIAPVVAVVGAALAAAVILVAIGWR
jgi:hypothetical protein